MDDDSRVKIVADEVSWHDDDPQELRRRIEAFKMKIVDFVAEANKEVSEIETLFPTHRVEFICGLKCCVKQKLAVPFIDMIPPEGYN